MNKEFCTYEQALELKELGFDEPCFCYWYTQQGCFPSIRGKDIQFNGWKNYPDSNTTAPLKQQVFRWFREKYQLQHNITWNKFYEKTPQQWEVRKQWIDEPIIPYGYGGMSKTYEEAEDACIDKLIEIVKK
mgnify:CR=1 FL=1